MVVLARDPAPTARTRSPSRTTATTSASVTLSERSTGGAALAWELAPRFTGQGYATRALRLVVDYAFRAIRLRPGARHWSTRATSRGIRVATRAGLRREGVLRGHRLDGDGREDRVVLRPARDRPADRRRRGGFRSLLNSFLPRKRAIAQMLVRDHDGPGAAVPADLQERLGPARRRGRGQRVAAAWRSSREVEEELGLDLAAGPLLLTDWLPPWSGWDDALCLVFDGGVHDAVARSTTRCCRPARSARRSSARSTRCASTAPTSPPGGSSRRCVTLATAGGPAYTESGRF